MKLRAPDGCASICHEGQIFVVDPDGSLDVEDDMVAVLAAHGFVPCERAVNEALPFPPGEGVDIDTLNRSGLFGFLRANGVRASRRDTNEELRTAARKALGSRRDPEAG